MKRAWDHVYRWPKWKIDHYWARRLDWARRAGERDLADRKKRNEWDLRRLIDYPNLWAKAKAEQIREEWRQKGAQ